MQGFLNAVVYSMNRKLRQRYWSCLCGDVDLEGGGNGKAVAFLESGNERSLSSLPGDRLLGDGGGSSMLSSPTSSLSSTSSPLGKGGPVSVEEAGAFERMRALLSGLPTLRRTLSEGKLAAWSTGAAGSSPLLGEQKLPHQCEYLTKAFPYFMSTSSYLPQRLLLFP